LGGPSYLYLQVLVLVQPQAREKGAREYLCSTVPECALETVEMGQGAWVCFGGPELQLQRLHRCCSRERAARSRHVMTGKVRAARPISARTGG
jgi:hypothetical protein